MKIGIMTFHWGTNYGAVLQAYALSEYLKGKNHDVAVINYYPRKYNKNILRAILTKRIGLIPGRIRDVFKNKYFDAFRNNNLVLSKRYVCGKQLTECNKNFDCFICGSDQIWNKSFIRYAESPKETYAYFLDFVNPFKLKASYAASFGDVVFPEKYLKKITGILNTFNAVSVRENSGMKILKDAGVENVCTVPDPAFLLTENDYKKFVTLRKEGNYAFSYMLHGNENDALPIYELCDAKKIKVKKCDNTSVEKWLSDIYNSQFVITNSFHGVAFSIIFRKKFVAFSIEGSGMNDRLFTLLSELDLENRMFNGNLSIIDHDINWDKVEERLSQYRKRGYDFLGGLIEKI